ncbi:MAG: hypothetical protein M3Q81_00030 [bacterium]|nr:hypothetical protein [bacterium]
MRLPTLTKTSFTKGASGFYAVLLCMGLLMPLYMSAALSAEAATNAGDSYLRFDRMAAAADPGALLIVFTTSSTVQTEAKLKITLDSEWVSATNFSATAANYTTTSTGIPADATVFPITGSVASAVSGNTITFALSGPLVASTKYAVIVQDGTGFILNPAASNTQTHTLFTTDSGDVIQDTSSITTNTISNDQISVSATVAPTFTFTLSGNTAAFGTLSTSVVNSATARTVTIVSNATNGWIVWLKSANAALTSASAGNYTIDTTGTTGDATDETLVAGTEGYVVDVDLTTDAASGGTVTINGDYDGADTDSGGTLSSTFQTVASADGTANSDVITLTPRAAIAGQTPAASDYADTLTVVGAGVF